MLKEARRAIDAANTLQQKRESCKRKLQELLDSQLFDLSMTRPRHVHDMSIARAQELLDSHATDAAVLRNRIELAEGMGVVGDALRELKQRLAAALQQARRRPRAGGAAWSEEVEAAEAAKRAAAEEEAQLQRAIEASVREDAARDEAGQRRATVSL